MNIYTFEKVSAFLLQHNAENVYHNKREYFFRTTYPTIYADILAATSFLPKPSFIERLYCFTNNITARPVCKCGKETTFSAMPINGERKYHTYCSHRCAILDMSTLIGVQNTSQLQIVKDKKKTSSLAKYGTDSPTQSAEIRKIQSEKRTAWWNEVYQHKDFTKDGLTRTQYKHRAQQYAITQYNRYKDILDPDGLRGKEWHVDHVYSMTDGFINDVPINIISDISNLRMLPAIDNYKKHKSSHKTLSALYEDYYATQSS